MPYWPRPVETISRGPHLVAKRKAMLIRRKLGHELAYRRVRGKELPKIAHLSATAGSAIATVLRM
jgi:hypothetical protein